MSLSPTDPRKAVITGVGVVCPLGAGRDEFWQALDANRSGVETMRHTYARELPVRFAGEVRDFEAKKYVKPRKSLKVMSRDIQHGMAAAAMAMDDAALSPTNLDPTRFGVVLGAEMLYCVAEELDRAFGTCIEEGQFDFPTWGKDALGEMNPLWLLKYLPNMTACHIGISVDARGPNNSITHGDVSSAMAIGEAQRLIERGAADVIITGGSGSRVSISMLSYRSDKNWSHREDDPAGACRPFDANRDGVVNGEGAGILILESRQHAEARGANILATILDSRSGFEPRGKGGPFKGTAIRNSIRAVLSDADESRNGVGFVSANGLSTRIDDRVEAQAIQETLGDVPVTAFKSRMGDIGAGSGAVEMIAAVLALTHRKVPATLNYTTPDPECPVQVIAGSPLDLQTPIALCLSQSMMGQATATLLAAP
jgi:3-oxoacyl-[acyl-carrier-protein] synthase II